MKRRKRRARHAGRRDAFHLTMIAVLMTVLCLMIVNIKEPEQTEEEQPETTHAEVVQNPETIVQTAEETESKYKVFDGMSEDWGSDDLEGFVLYKLPEQYADKSACDLARVISFEAFSMMVDEALERMKKMLESNKAMQTLVSGEAGEVNE